MIQCLKKRFLPVGKEAWPDTPKLPLQMYKLHMIPQMVNVNNFKIHFLPQEIWSNYSIPSIWGRGGRCLPYRTWKKEYLINPNVLRVHQRRLRGGGIIWVRMMDKCTFSGILQSCEPVHHGGDKEWWGWESECSTRPISPPLALLNLEMAFEVSNHPRGCKVRH